MAWRKSVELVRIRVGAFFLEVYALKLALAI